MQPLERAREAEIEWSQIVGMRHRIVHAYDRVDHAVLWVVLQEELPLLAKKLEAVLASL